MTPERPLDTSADRKSPSIRTDTEPAETPTDAERADSLTDVGPTEPLTDAEPAESGTDAETAESGTDAEPAESGTDAEPADSLMDAEPVESGTDAEPVEAGTDAEPAEDARPRRGHRRRRASSRARYSKVSWILLGLGGVFLLLGITATLLVTGVIGDEKPAPARSPGQNVAPPPAGGGTSPVKGVIRDNVAGLRYAKLGGGWSVKSAQRFKPSRHGLRFTSGEEVTVQKNYRPGVDYSAIAYAMPLPKTIHYAGPADLKQAATSLANRVELDFYPSEHSRGSDRSTALSVGGQPAWHIEYTLTFPNAKARGWSWQAEKIGVLVIDRGPGKRPGAFYISMPDSVSTQGDYRLLLKSVKPLR